MIENIVKSAATILVLVLCVATFGWLSYERLPRESAPDIKIPVVMVSTPYIGVSPSDIENLVTTPLEKELGNVRDLKKMTSTSAEGVSLITLEFVPEVVIEDALQRVRDAVGRAESDIPAEAEDTQIREISFSDVPIMLVTIAGPLDEAQLKKLGEDLEDRVERIPGVMNAVLSGGREREIKVLVDPTRLEHYGLSLTDVLGSIRNENVNVPGGEVVVGNANVLLRVPGEFVTAADVADVAIKRSGGRPVFIRDVARVEDTFAERKTYARMNGRPAVSLAITKRTGANILDVATRVKEAVANEAKSWPEGVEYRVLGDQSKMIKNMVSDLENGILTALVLVVAVILVFMGVRNSLFVAISIPLSFMLSMIVIELLDMTLNMMVLFSLILALGMLVDNAIVIVENVYRHAENGVPMPQAAIVGTSEVALAVAASTATTVAAFLPLIFWSGIMGQFMGFMPKTVIIVLVASLVVAIGVLPVLTSKMMKVRSRTGPEKGDLEDLSFVGNAYLALLRGTIRFRYPVILVGLITLIGTFVYYAGNNHGTEFFPETDPERAIIKIRAADGTDIEATDRVVREVEAIVTEFENVDVYVAETGIAGGGDPLEGAQAAANQARITIDFRPDASSAKKGQLQRVEPTPTTVERIRERLATVAGAEVTIDKEEMGPPVGKPISVEITGDDFHELGAYAANVRREIEAKVEGSTDLRDDYRVGRPEMRIRVNRGAAKRVGASTNDIAMTVRTAVAGTKASALRDGDDEYDIMVELDPRFREDLQSVFAMRIPGREDTNPDTFAVPLSSVASYEITGGTGSIRHIDQKRVVTIEGDIADGYNENSVREAVIAYIADAKTPDGIAMRLGGANDEQLEAQAFLLRAFGLAFFLILLVIVWQFNRIDIPLIIMSSVVLSLIGVLWGLLITGTPFGVIMTGLGVISLAGVVVNNAIVLLDYVEQLRAQGSDSTDALLRAGLARFRPVFLTATTTVLGLVPMALGISVDFRKLQISSGSPSSQWWSPMAIAVIFGLAVATVLTLVFVPTMYAALEDFRGLGARLRLKTPAPKPARLYSNLGELPPEIQGSAAE